MVEGAAKSEEVGTGWRLQQRYHRIEHEDDNDVRMPELRKKEE